MLITPLVVASMVGDQYDILKTVLSILAYFVIFAWYFMVGSSLNDRLPDEDYRSDILFKVNCAYLFAFLSVSAIFKDGSEEVQSEIPPFIIILSLYYIFAFLHVVHFSASSFLSVQEREVENLGKRRIEIVYLSFLIFIIGVWVLQPRLKSIFS